MRTFIAVDFPLEYLQKINEIANYFKSQTPEDAVKWVNPENMHLTVKFLGDLPLENLDEAKRIMDGSVGDWKPFEISVSGLGMYPNAKKPRVIWLGVHPEKPLVHIHQRLDQNLAALNIQREQRKYSPHLTLGRVRRMTDRDSVSQIGKTLSQFKVDSLGTIEVIQINLYQSDLTPKGPIYTKLHTTLLNQV